MSLAFGLTVLTMASAIGHVSGCHLNPAVSVALWAGKRFPASDLLSYIVAQIIGRIIGAGLLLIGALAAGFSYSWLASEVGEPVVGKELGPVTA